MSILENIKKDYKKVSDLVVKDIKSIHIIYLETLVSQDKINEYILKFTNVYHIPKDIKKLIPSPNIKDISNYDDLKLFLETGFTIIINKNQMIAIETKGELTRSIESPSTEPTLYGAKDSLNENFQTNLGLIKRRIKSEHLKDETFN
ncbi:MAG: spore germination protein, partial [Bacilli bacterium]|nr:spore germination protein [Bacilli bacterium]